MNPTHRLETPPPLSQFRRPWSPDPHDPFPPFTTSHANHDYNDFNPYQTLDLAHDDPHQFPLQQRRNREPSDVSVEALDLADYAQTMNARQAANLVHTVDPRDMYSRFPRSPPRSHTLSGESLLQPSSLVSRMNTLSTTTHTFESSRQTTHRPYSVPEPARIHSQTSIARSTINNPLTSEIDISQFPAWSRSWYASAERKNKPGAGSPDYDLDTAPPPRLSIFDPAYKPEYDYGYHSASSHAHGYSPAHSSQHASTREYLPWSSDQREDGVRVSAETKEERIRMLERAFGPKSKSPSHVNDAFVDAEGHPLVGTVDAKGRLVTQGPKKRVALRVLQVSLALVAAIPSIYAALAIKPKEGPPPAGKPAAYILYVLSVITSLCLLYLFLFRPCCVNRKRKTPFGENPLANGMMVLPVQGMPSGKGGKKKQKGKKKGDMNAASDVHVNLIVDPNAFIANGKGEDSDEEEDEWGSDTEVGYLRRGRKKRGNAKRRSVFAGLAMEQEWKHARAWAKKIMVVDVVGMVLWGAMFVFILIGKRCPSSGFEGWCNAYNVSSAAGCLLCIGFGVNVFLDIKDLHASKDNPRTRT